MDELVPPHYITSKITLFTSVEDPENHLKAFKTQMILSGGSDTIRCKVFMSTFTRIALQWFSGIPDGHIVEHGSFDETKSMMRA